MNLTDLFRLAEALVPTGFLPDAIKTPGQAVAIILAGRELGLPPMRALRSLSMVKGKVTENADSQLARFKAEGGRAIFETLDDTTAVLRLTHPNGDTHLETFTFEDAKRAGLLASGMYGKFPRAMLRSRAITAGLKSLGWSGAAGNYDPDELQIDEVPHGTAQPVIEVVPHRPEVPKPTPKATPAPPPKVAPATATAPTEGVMEGVLSRISSKSGETRGKAWTRYGLLVTQATGAETWINTFDADAAALAKSLSNREVIVTYKTSTDKSGRIVYDLIAIDPLPDSSEAELPEELDDSRLL